MSLAFFLAYEIDGNEVEVFSGSITNNLCKMAYQAGVSKALWRPEEIDAVYAKDIVTILTGGLAGLESRPDYFKQFNPENGYGSYEYLVSFVRNCLDACKQYPNAKISVWR